MSSLFSGGKNPCPLYSETGLGGSNCSCRGHRLSAEVVVRPPSEAVVRPPNEGAPDRRARGTSAAATCQGPLRFTQVRN
jgi:hypothetical protein